MTQPPKGFILRETSRYADLTEKQIVGRIQHLQSKIRGYRLQVADLQAELTARTRPRA